MSASKWFVAALGIAAAATIVAVYLDRTREPAPAPPVEPDVVVSVPDEPAPLVPAEQYPIPEAAGADAPAESLPALNDSDGAARSALAGLLGRKPVEAFLVPDQLLRRAVATLDSLTRAPALQRVQLLKPVPGVPKVSGAGDTLQLAPDNARRYDRVVAWLGGIDAPRAAQLYFHWYPALRRAYVELGYPDGHLNDRVVAVIDHLLATPVVDGPLRLVRPKVLYEFADPGLEALSSGQKILLRVGPQHAATLKARLRELRAILVAGAPTS